MLLTEAKRGVVTEEMIKVARKEGREPEEVRRGVAAGRIVIPRNPKREIEILGIGDGLSVKVNANVGTSPDYLDPSEEVNKAKIAVKYGADTVMDLSIAGDLRYIRRAILKEIKQPVGTVPVYQVVVEKVRNSFSDINTDDFFDVVREHALDGVDFMTIHCGVTLELVKKLRKSRRILGMVSRGGGFLAAWMLETGNENPFYKEFDYLLEIAREYEICLSLGDGFRPGCLADASDELQLSELFTIGKLVERAWEKDVQVIVEGPGHVPIDQIEANVKLAKSVCRGAPLYLLGPLPLDSGAGYDHICAAIGGVLAALAGADFLCYVTPGEHLCLPTAEDVREGVVAAKIAAMVANIARGYGWERELAIANARARLDWAEQIKLSVNPERASYYRSQRPPALDPKTCSMCSKFCVIKLVQGLLA